MIILDQHSPTGIKAHGYIYKKNKIYWTVFLPCEPFFDREQGVGCAGGCIMSLCHLSSSQLERSVSVPCSQNRNRNRINLKHAIRSATQCKTNTTHPSPFQSHPTTRPLHVPTSHPSAKLNALVPGPAVAGTAADAAAGGTIVVVAPADCECPL